MSIKNDVLNLDSKFMEEDSKNEINKKIIEENKFVHDKLGFYTNIYIPFLYQPIDIQNLDQKKLFSKYFIFYSFNSQDMTKYLQKCLINASKEIITFIIEELKGNFRAVIKNKNGNCFCSDLIKICGQDNRIKILKELSNILNEDSMDEFGTYPIQNLIEYASTEYELKLLLTSFNEYEKILMPALNPHGTFVIQKLIRHIPEKLRKDFNSIFVKFVSLLARDTYGVFALEKFISYTKDEQIHKQIYDSIINNFIDISTNKSGNYLIQNLLGKWWNNKKGENLKKLIKSKFSLLSNNIYGVHICQLYNKLSKSNEESNLDSSLK